MRLNQLQKLPRQLHVALCVLMFVLISWALLSGNPFAAVRNTPLTHLRTVSDIILHLGAYTVFATLCFSLIGPHANFRVRRAATVLLVVHAIGTEWLQMWMPNRTTDPLDAAANLCGIAAGALLATWVFRFRSSAQTSLSE